jgi:hypothetical protein
MLSEVLLLFLKALYQGTTLVVPQKTAHRSGFSPCYSGYQGLKPSFLPHTNGTTEVVP